MEQRTDPLIGSMLDGRYLVSSEIAAGGMATVYRGHDTRLDRAVAIKVMHPHLAKTPGLTDRFRAEARAIAKVTHPAIVAIHDQGQIEGRGYLVMEYISGPSLRELLRQQGSLTLRQALEVTEQILVGLSAAHQVGLIHRDIKPENILLTRDGQPKIADFGLAHLLGEATGYSTSAVMGTVDYMAPELVNGETPDASCDIYAAGLMLSEMISGKLPFPTGTPISVAWAHVTSDPEPVHQQFDWVPEQVDDAIGVLAAREARSRPADAAAAAVIIRDLLDSLPDQVLNKRSEVPDKADSDATAMLEQVSNNRETAILTGAAKRQSQTEPYRFIPVNPPALTNSAETTGAGGNETAKTIGKPRNISVSEPESPEKKLKKHRIWPILLLVFVIAAAISVAAWWFLAGPGSRITVPSVAGQSQTQAVKQLRNAGFEVILQREFSDTVDRGKAVGTDPEGGTKAYPDQPVRLYISKGIEMVRVPNITGKTQRDGTAALQKAKLKVGTVSEEYSDTVAAGQVIATDPKAGQSVKHDSIVKLTVSKGKEPVTVPDLAGSTLTEAQKVVETLKLKVSSSENYSDTVPKGAIISQDPAAGETRYHGDEIKVVVSKGPEMVAVPDVVRKSEADARQTLEAAGFVVNVNRLFSIADKVAQTDPAAGTVVKVGSTVTITVI
ncbi:MAG: Stk1 family PASTA domain-containing Ser/Thr kinase [Varibaculum sp.]|nr:Stk1 family PASTA domain-containing Ser/Thr kinase [Varibaculum sp.]